MMIFKSKDNNSIVGVIVGLFIVLLFSSSCLNVNSISKIEKLKTRQQVKDFVYSLDSLDLLSSSINTKINSPLISIHKRKADSLGFESNFIKADFDQNGLIDIIVIGLYEYEGFNTMLILDKGNEKYELIDLVADGYSYFGNRNLNLKGECIFPKIHYKGGIPIIDVYYGENKLFRMDSCSTEGLSKTSLIYKFNGLIEYNSKPVNQKVEKIDLIMRGGIAFGSFELSIHKDGRGILINDRNGFYNNFEKLDKGKFETEIKGNTYKKLFNILNYLELDHLKDYYPIGLASIHPSISHGKLILKYGGNRKEISSFGLRGHLGLEKIFSLLLGIRENQEWNQLCDPSEE